MEMRAREETRLPQDLTPPIPPLAAALHRRFLPSHCSSCFRSLESPLPCANCGGAVRYCSAACLAADFSSHASSGECHLLRHHHHPQGDETSDLRVALRFLHFLESLRPLPLVALPERPRRVAGLLASDLEKVLEEGGEVAARITEGAAVMLLVKDRDRSREGGGEAATAKEVLWAVLTNAVEVHVSEVGAVGVAVYGPGLSWFNHSCVPNACYRFEMAHCSGEPGSAEPVSFLVSPAAAGVATDAVRSSISLCESIFVCFRER